MKPGLRTILLDYDDGDDISGAIMAYDLDGDRLCRDGLAYYDDRDHIYRRKLKKGRDA